jgi:lipoyl(octanoyl) transferase
MGLSLRIINDGRRNAPFNMAADRLLLDTAAVQNAVTLRLYAWELPTISFGLLQKPLSLLDKEAMSQGNIEWILRPTGGRAVLHWNDLTYSIVFPLTAVSLGRTIAESYSVVSRCLRRGLELAGVPCVTHDSPVEYSATKRDMRLPCFLAPNRNEIMAAGKKLVGSAQKRTTSAVLQHGSIPVDGSFRRLPEFLSIAQEEKIRQQMLLEKKCICVNEINPAIDYGKLSICLIKGFAETLKLSAVEKPWDEEEISAILNSL